MTNPVAATAADAPALAAIHAGAFPQGWSAADIAALLRSPGCYARWVPGQAFILVRAVLDEAEIITLATVPARRRQGLAQALVGQTGAFCLAQGVTVLHLEVAAGNVPAQAFAESDLPRPGCPVWLVGDGAARAAARLLARGAPVALGGPVLAHAVGVGLAACAMLRGELPSGAAEPLYIDPPATT